MVEDDDQVRETCCAILKRNGYRVLSSEHGAAALRASEQYSGKIHLLLTDVVMPEMGGPELAERLAAVRPELAVLYVSGYTETPGIVFLQKPITPEVLLRRVREVLDAT